MRRSRALLAGTVSALIAGVLAATPAAAACPGRAGTVQPFLAPTTTPGTVSFTGGGWGHGVGMSQHGARGAAELGCKAGQILRGYYPGSSITRPGNLVTPRVGLLMGSSTVVANTTITNTGTAPVRWRFGDQVVHTQAPGASVTITASTQPRLSIRPSLSGTPHWTQPATGAATLRAALGPERAIRIAGKQVRGETVTYNRGVLHIESAREGPPGTIEQVLAIGMENYLRGLNEMPYSWHMEALRAQAIAGRTYAHASASKRPGCSCTLFDSIQDQVYSGALEELRSPSSWARWSDAVTGTRGRIVTHDGQPVVTFYSSSNGGVSMASTNGHPSLIAQNTARWENAAADGNSLHRWRINHSASTVAAEFGLDALTDVSVTRTSVGRVATVTFTGRDGGSTVSRTVAGKDLRSRLGLYSDFFDVTYASSASTPFTDVVVGDLDGDGRDEFVLHDRATGRLTAHATTSTGQLGARLGTTTVAAGWDTVTMGDVDGDGDDEYVFHRTSGGVAVYEATATGGLGARHSTWDAPAGTVTLAVADVYPGGGEELVTLHGDGQVQVFSLDASGAPGARLARGPVLENATSLATPDVDGDGRAEIAVYRRGNGVLRLHAVTPHGRLSSPLSHARIGTGWTGLVAAEVDGDADSELVFSRASMQSVAVYDGGTSGAPGQLLRSWSLSGNWSDVGVGDLNGDGEQELVLHRGSDGLVIVRELADGRVGRQVGRWRVSPGWTTVTPVDVNGDGNDELLFHRSSTGGVAVYNSSRSALGSLRTSYTVSSGWTSITVGDVGGDDADELIFHRASTGGVAVYPVTHAGRLRPRLSLWTVAPDWTNLVTGDFDGDRRLDLVFQRSSTGVLAGYATNHRGQLGERILAGNAGTGWTQVAATRADFDRDDDLVSYRGGTGTVAIHDGMPALELGTRLSTWQG